MQSEKKDTPVGFMIDEAYFLLSLEFGSNGASFVKELDCEDAKIYVDSEQIKRVFMNIFKNAFQVMKDDGQLMVKGRVNNGRMEIGITDNGPGISPENLEKIFDPFFTTKEKGVGLGLAIVKKIVENNGGEISVESKLGEYTTFNLSLPLSIEAGKS
jgi:signal transduction histidine kinase